MNHAEIFQCEERIARGEACPSCGARWLPVVSVPAAEERIPNELVHELWCEYWAYTGLERHTISWIDEANHARVHVVARWQHPEDKYAWKTGTIVVDREEMADYNVGTRVVLERWMAEETRSQNDPEGYSLDRATELFSELQDLGVSELDLKDATVNDWLEVLRCFIQIGPEATHDGDHFGGPYWIRSRPSGTLMLAVFPQGDTYDSISSTRSV